MKICLSIAGAVISALLAVLLAEAVSIPWEYYDPLTDECVGVWVKDELLDCKFLPDHRERHETSPGVTYEELKAIFMDS